jgi:hypothetical protein
MGQLGTALSDGLKMTIGYADALVKTIPDARFAEMPKDDLNSPAFLIGHLAIYAPKVAEMMGHSGACSVPASWEELFKNGAKCVSTPGTYPPKAELVKAFTDGWTTVANLLPKVDDSVFNGPNPYEGLRDRLPNVAGVASFMCLAHNMMHLGQISAWRRVAGLGSAM